MSQSERVVWLCEELGIEYELKVYERDPLLAPQSLKSLPGNYLGTAPVIQDGDVTLSESGAIVEWIIQRHGKGRFMPKPTDPDYAQYLQWFHFANATLQSSAGRVLMVTMMGSSPSGAGPVNPQERLTRILQTIDGRLGKAKYLAGENLTAADIMMVFSLSTMRYFVPLDLSEYKNIVRYLKMISEREAYQRAMEKGDGGMELLMDGNPPKKTRVEMIQERQANQQTGSKLS